MQETDVKPITVSEVKAMSRAKEAENAIQKQGAKTEIQAVGEGGENLQGNPKGMEQGIERVEATGTSQAKAEEVGLAKVEPTGKQDFIKNQESMRQGAKNLKASLLANDPGDKNFTNGIVKKLYGSKNLDKFKTHDGRELFVNKDGDIHDMLIKGDTNHVAQLDFSDANLPVLNEIVGPKGSGKAYDSLKTTAEYVKKQSPDAAKMEALLVAKESFIAASKYKDANHVSGQTFRINLDDMINKAKIKVDTDLLGQSFEAFDKGDNELGLKLWKEARGGE